jgi:molybdate transport system regulatory protein
VKPKLKAWVVLSERVKLGDGGARLLEAIDELGSIQKAVGRLGMSYRKPWGLPPRPGDGRRFQVLGTPGGGRAKKRGAPDAEGTGVPRAVLAVPPWT